MLRQAAEERSQIHDPIPTYLYFDEAADYFDEQFPILLSQVRKHNIGCVVVNQFVDQAEPRLVSALTSLTSTKFVGGVSPRDAKRFAPAMNTTDTFIRDQPKLTFAAHIKEVTHTAFPCKIPRGYMERQPKMSDAEREQLRSQMRERYAVHYTKIPARPQPKAPRPGASKQSPSPSSGSAPHKGSKTKVKPKRAQKEPKRESPQTASIDNPEIEPSEEW